MKCLLDLDGVLVNFVKGACKLHGKPDPYQSGDWTGFDIAEAWEMKPASFWGPMGYEFWSDLEWTVDGREILETVERFIGSDNICICSSPCSTRGCADGKIEWIRRNMPKYKRRYMLTPIKYFASCVDTLLIDDMDENIVGHVKVSRSGSSILNIILPSILIPRPWNAGRVWNRSGSMSDYLTEELRNFKV
jgi:hypothetical protein